MTIPRTLWFALTLVAAPGAAAAQAGGATPPVGTHLGFSAERLARIDRLLQGAVDSNRIAGAVALVLRDGQVAYEKAVGPSSAPTASASGSAS